MRLAETCSSRHRPCLAVCHRGGGPPRDERVEVSRRAFLSGGDDGGIGPCAIAVGFWTGRTTGCGRGLAGRPDATAGLFGAISGSGGTRTLRTVTDGGVGRCDVEGLLAGLCACAAGGPRRSASLWATWGTSAFKRSWELERPGMAKAPTRVVATVWSGACRGAISKSPLSRASPTAKNVPTEVESDRARAPTKRKACSQATETEPSSRDRLLTMLTKIGRSAAAPANSDAKFVLRALGRGSNAGSPTVNIPVASYRAAGSRRGSVDVRPCHNAEWRRDGTPSASFSPPLTQTR